VCACLLLALAAAGCRSAPVRQTARVVEPEPVAIETPSAPTAANHLVHAEELFSAGDLAAAAAEYEAHLADGDEVEGGDLALFRLALLRLTRNSPLYDPAAGSLLLVRLVDVHPHSPFADSASLILDLRRANRQLDGENDRLRDQLEELRRIDLGDGEDFPL
jgi:hypothetical protein